MLANLELSTAYINQLIGNNSLAVIGLGISSQLHCNIMCTKVKNVTLQ